MNNEVAIRPVTQVSLIDFTAEQLDLITRTVAPKATPQELQLFLYRCKALGLDPLKPGQIHFVKYDANSTGTIVVGIEGFRAKAQRTGKFSGIKRGVLRDDKGKLIGAWAEVYRSDWKECAREEVPLAEYNTNRGPWSKMPETMIKKVAEAAALRMAFPDDLGGVYETAEMDQAVKDTGPVAPEQPAEGDGNQPQTWPGVYRMPKGKWAQRSLQEVANDPKNGPQAIASYVSWFEGNAEKSGKPIDGWAIEFIAEAEKFLGALENGKGLEGAGSEPGWKEE